MVNIWWSRFFCTESWVNKKKPTILTIKLIEKFGLKNIGDRVLGVKLKTEVLEELNNNKNLIINFDFNGVESISTAFAKELFGELYRSLKINFTQKIKITLPKDDVVIKSLIVKGISSVKEVLS